jgi:hypothetical protein
LGSRTASCASFSSSSHGIGIQAKKAIQGFGNGLHPTLAFDFAGVLSDACSRRHAATEVAGVSRRGIADSPLALNRNSRKGEGKRLAKLVLDLEGGNMLAQSFAKVG